MEEVEPVEDLSDCRYKAELYVGDEYQAWGGSGVLEEASHGGGVELRGEG